MMINMKKKTNESDRMRNEKSNETKIKLKSLRQTNKQKYEHHFNLT